METNAAQPSTERPVIPDSIDEEQKLPLRSLASENNRLFDNKAFESEAPGEKSGPGTRNSRRTSSFDGFSSVEELESGQRHSLTDETREKVGSIFEKLLEEKNPEAFLSKQTTLRSAPVTTKKKFGSFFGKFVGKGSTEQLKLPPVAPDCEKPEVKLKKRKEKVAAILERLAAGDPEEEFAKKIKAKRRPKKEKSIARSSSVRSQEHSAAEEEEQYSFSDTDSILSYHVSVHPGRGKHLNLKASAAAAAEALFPTAEDEEMASIVNHPPKSLKEKEIVDEPEIKAASPGNESEVSASLLAGISEYELKALEAFTAGEGGLLGEHSAESLREMAMFHKQKTLRDSEILTSLVEFAEQEEKQKLTKDYSDEEVIIHDTKDSEPRRVPVEPEIKPEGEEIPAREPKPVAERTAAAKRASSAIAKAALGFLAKQEQLSAAESSRVVSQRPPRTAPDQTSARKSVSADSELPEQAESDSLLQKQAGMKVEATLQGSKVSEVPKKMTISRVERTRSHGGSYDLENTPLFGKNGLERQKPLEEPSAQSNSATWQENVKKAAAFAGEKATVAKKWFFQAKESLVARYKPVSEDVLEEVPKKTIWLPGDPDFEKKKGKGSVVEWLCDWRFILLLGVLFLVLVSILAISDKRASGHLGDQATAIQSPPSVPPPVFSPPPPPVDSPVCQGPCCSNKSPVVPVHQPKMVSSWPSNQLAHMSVVHIRCLSSGKFLGPVEAGASWTTVGGFQKTLSASETLTVLRVSSTQVRFQTPDGYFLAAKENGDISGDHTFQDQETVFTVLPVNGSASDVVISAYDGKFLVVLPDGSVGRSVNGKMAEVFQANEVMILPAQRGVNLANWVLSEQWLDPSLFITVPMFTDGLYVQIQSVHYGSWLTVLPNGAVNCSVKEPGEWETFRLRVVNKTEKVFQFRTQEYLFLRVFSGDNFSLFGDGTLSSGGANQQFELIFNPNDHTEFMVLAGNGNLLTVNDDGSVTASVAPSSLNLRAGHTDWNGPTVFGYNETGAVRGEWQLTHNLNDQTEPILERHRQSWVTEGDFEWLAQQKINAVRVPVGYWTTEEASEYPYAASAVGVLDSAFSWAEKHGIRIFLEMNGAAGSQNGLEHSGSRDGVPAFSTNQTNVLRTLAAVEWYAARYGNSSAFHGIGLLNLPSSEVHLNVLRSYYEAGYARVRKHSACAFVGIQPRTGGDPYELDTVLASEEYHNVVLERSFFNIYNPMFSDIVADEHIALVSVNRTLEIEDYQQSGRPLVVSGWSLGLPANVQPTDQNIRDFADAQLAAYGVATGGWYFLNYINNLHGWSTWDFRASVLSGLLREKEGGGW